MDNKNVANNFKLFLSIVEMIVCTLTLVNNFLKFTMLSRNFDDTTEQLELLCPMDSLLHPLLFY